MIKKVIAYITRLHNGQRQLLVYGYKDHPEAGKRVPARIVGKNETIEDALYREIEEKCGLTHLISKNKIKEYIYYDECKAEYYERHVFHLEVAEEMCEKRESIIPSHNLSEGLILCCQWGPLEVISRLEAGKDDDIHLLFNEIEESALR